MPLSAPKAASSLNVRTRIAPTPTGYLHEGNAFNAVLTWVRARSLFGSVLLRIDDADFDKMHGPFVDDIFETLRWLQIDWDEGPVNAQELSQAWSQRLRYDRYHSVIEQLRNEGQLFACDCSRKHVRSVTADGQYPGTCHGKGLSLDTPNVAWRLNAPDAAIAHPVVRQRNGAPAYMLVSIVDDLDYGITHIVRGDDLRPTTDTQRYISQRLADLAPYQKIAVEHHPLITDSSGGKLSKSQGSTDLRQWRAEGKRPASIIHRVAAYVGVQGTTPQELVAALRR